MVILQYLEGKQLAWKRRTDDILDGQTLAAVDCCGLCDCGCGGRPALVGVECLDCEGQEDEWWEE